MKSTVVAILCITVSSTSAMAADTWDNKKFYVHLGPAGLLFDSSAHVSLAGNHVPGGNAILANNSGVEFEAGYYLCRNLSVGLTGGVPPTTKASGRGTLSNVGELGIITYGPAILHVDYHVQSLGRFKPYLGVGVLYGIIFNAGDRALRNVNASDAFGPAIGGGFDYQITRHLGIYFDVKKMWAYTDVSFKYPTPAALVPGNARIYLDPLLLSSGLTIRF